MPSKKIQDSRFKIQDKNKNSITVNPKIYLSLFQVNPDGRKILTEMAFKFYDRLSYTEKDSHATAFREGQRSVIQFIIQKCADAQE